MFKTTFPKMTKFLATGAVAVAGLMAGMSAQAHGGVSLSVGVGVPGMAMGIGAPVYMPPPPVYYAPPRPVYYAPRPVYFAPPVVYAPPPPMPPVYFAPPPPPPRPVYYGYGQVYTPVAVAPPYYYGAPVRRWDRDHWRHDRGHGWGHRDHDRGDWDRR